MIEQSLFLIENSKLRDLCSLATREEIGYVTERVRETVKVEEEKPKKEVIPLLEMKGLSIRKKLSSFLDWASSFIQADEMLFVDDEGLILHRVGEEKIGYSAISMVIKYICKIIATKECLFEYLSIKLGDNAIYLFPAKLQGVDITLGIYAREIEGYKIEAVVKNIGKLDQ